MRPDLFLLVPNWALRALIWVLWAFIFALFWHFFKVGSFSGRNKKALAGTSMGVGRARIWPLWALWGPVSTLCRLFGTYSVFGHNSLFVVHKLIFLIKISLLPCELRPAPGKIKVSKIAIG